MISPQFAMLFWSKLIGTAGIDEKDVKRQGTLCHYSSALALSMTLLTDGLRPLIYSVDAYPRQRLAMRKGGVRSSLFAHSDPLTATAKICVRCLHLHDTY